MSPKKRQRWVMGQAAVIYLKEQFENNIINLQKYGIELEKIKRVHQFIELLLIHHENKFDVIGSMSSGKIITQISKTKPYSEAEIKENRAELDEICQYSRGRIPFNFRNFYPNLITHTRNEQIRQHFLSRHGRN